MKRGNPNWVKGVSGNPKGGPTKTRSLTYQIEKLSEEEIQLNNNRITRNELLAKSLWDLINYGKFIFPNGREIIVANAKEWMNLVFKMLNHVDGLPPQRMEIVAEEDISKIDLSELTDEELGILMKIYEK